MRSFFRLTPLLSLLLLLTSCGWDDDAEYEIRTQATFLLGEDPNTGARSLARYDGTAWELDWEDRLGLADGALGQMNLAEGQLWAGAARTDRLVASDPATGEVTSEINLAGAVPHYFAIGERYIVAVDTNAAQLTWHHRRKEETFTIDLPESPGRILYNSATFYVQVGARTLSIMDERAIAERAEVELDHPIVSLQFDRYNNIYVMTFDGTQHYHALVSAVDLRIARAETVADFTQAEVTPYFEARFGSEWLTDVQLRTEGVWGGNTILRDTADAFAVDFFESTLLAQEGDSLYAIDMDLRQETARYYWAPRLVAAEYWRGE